MRTIKQVIAGFFHALDEIDYVGFSCEPIATAQDPDDRLEGDTVCHVSIGRLTTDNRLFCSPWRVTFPMQRMREMPEDQFQRNLKQFTKEAADYANTPIGKQDIVVMSSPGVSSMEDTLHALLKADKLKHNKGH